MRVNSIVVVVLAEASASVSLITARIFAPFRLSYHHICAVHALLLRIHTLPPIILPSSTIPFDPSAPPLLPSLSLTLLQRSLPFIHTPSLPVHCFPLIQFPSPLTYESPAPLGCFGPSPGLLLLLFGHLLFWCTGFV